MIQSSTRSVFRCKHHRSALHGRSTKLAIAPPHFLAFMAFMAFAFMAFMAFFMGLAGAAGAAAAALAFIAFIALAMASKGGEGQHEKGNLRHLSQKAIQALQCRHH